MKLSELLPRTWLKLSIFIYILISISYISIQIYNTSKSPIRTARRSVLEPTSDTFFIAPLSQEIIEQDEQDQQYQQDKSKLVHIDYIKTEKKDPIIQSKLFSGAMGPSDVQSFYIKATENFNSQDITIATIVTSDRFPVLGRLATRYKGPISAAIHINDDENKERELDMLKKTLIDHPDIKKYVDIHLIIDKYDRQFNMWRNTAKLYTRTDYLMMLDIDFYLCTDFRKEILQNPTLMTMLKQGQTALVVPAFEYLDQSDGIDYSTFPETKNDLMHQIFDDQKLDMFHVSWEKGHSATNYLKWYTSDVPYKVQDYNFSYEPYVIFKKQDSPWCDERFIGYGANKAACLYEIYLSGIDYYVLPNDFLIHQSHYYPESTRKKERLFNRKVYANFREELCLRYSRQFVSDGRWDTPRSNNLRKECQKIRGFNNVITSIDQ